MEMKGQRNGVGGSKLVPFKEIADVEMGQSPPGNTYNRTGEGIPLINGPTEFTSKHPKKIQWTSKPTKVCRPGDLLLCVRGSSTGRINISDDTYCIGRGIAAIRAKESRAETTYLIQLLTFGTNSIISQASGSTFLNIDKTSLNKIKVFAPNKGAQIETVKVLREWDSAIEKTERLIATKKKRFGWLVWNLVFRQGNKKEEFGHRKIGKIAERITRKADGKQYPILTISSSSGFVLQEKKYSRFMAGKSLENYTLLKRGEFAYNKGNSLRYQFGCIFQLQEYEAALVPHVYVCFKLGKEVNANYLNHLFGADYLKPQLGALVNTGIRNNGLLNISPDAFMNVTVPVPPMDKQEKIGSILDLAAKEIWKLKVVLEFYRQQKRGLMQKLLTGKWQVSSEEKGGR